MMNPRRQAVRDEDAQACGAATPFGWAGMSEE
jgi:hypothetical protein